MVSHETVKMRINVRCENALRSYGLASTVCQRILRNTILTHICLFRMHKNLAPLSRFHQSSPDRGAVNKVILLVLYKHMHPRTFLVKRSLRLKTDIQTIFLESINNIESFL